MTVVKLLLKGCSLNLERNFQLADQTYIYDRYNRALAKWELKNMFLP